MGTGLRVRQTPVCRSRSWIKSSSMTAALPGGVKERISGCSGFPVFYGSFIIGMAQTAGCSKVIYQHTFTQ